MIAFGGGVDILIIGVVAVAGTLLNQHADSASRTACMPLIVSLSLAS
jgi:hypothetical protein